MNNHYKKQIFWYAGGKTLYLLDEHHHDDSSTDENITLALYLVENKNVCLIGVEGFNGGRPWHDGKEEYENGFLEEGLKNCISDYPRFGYDISKNKKTKVVGVDSETMCNKADIERHKIKGRHPLHELRSTHFMDTLLKINSNSQIECDLLLNCGAEHNDDIEKMINDGKAPTDWLKFNIIRLRPLLHPTGPF